MTFDDDPARSGWAPANKRGAACAAPLLCDSFGLPVVEADLIQPSGILRRIAVLIHLEGHADLVTAGGPGIEVLVDVVLHAIQSHGNELGLAAYPLQFPGEVIPGVGLRLGASDAGVDPVRVFGVPNAPSAGLLKGTLGTEDVLDAV